MDTLGLFSLYGAPRARTKFGGDLHASGTTGGQNYSLKSSDDRVGLIYVCDLRIQLLCTSLIESWWFDFER